MAPELNMPSVRRARTAQDYVEAARQYRLAAAQGHAVAQYVLGSLTSRGKGVPQNDAEAARLYGLAAAQGQVGAQYNLACIYSQGKGVPQNDAEAARLFGLGLAAAQGDVDAQFNLGRFCLLGRGVAHDIVEAARLLWLAANQGFVPSIDELTALASVPAYVSACCMGCGAIRKLKTCAKCKVARFCGAACVRRAWPAHKPQCKSWEPAVSTIDDVD
jgi:TPR repeat protein